MHFATKFYHRFFMLVVVEPILVVQNWFLLFVKFVRKCWTRVEDLLQLQDKRERLGDDELFSIFTQIHNPDDQISFVRVSKQFLKVACSRLIKLDNSYPDFLYDVIPNSPNLISFKSSKPLSNTHMKLLAQSCPKLMYLNLCLDQSFDHQVESKVTSSRSKSCSHLYDKSDFDDDGLCSIANACSNLREVHLRKRFNVGDVAIVSLVRSSKYLTTLDLWGWANVTNKSLKAIGKSNIQFLGLQGCHLITDMGLKYLVNGNVTNHLIEIIIAECGGITDVGVIDLKQMRKMFIVIRIKEITRGIFKEFGFSFYHMMETCLYQAR